MGPVRHLPTGCVAMMLTDETAARMQGPRPAGPAQSIMGGARTSN